MPQHRIRIVAKLGRRAMLDRMLRQDQVDQNYESFKRLMPELLRAMQESMPS